MNWEDKVFMWFMLVASLLVIAWLLLGCASQPDMSRREAVNITGLAIVLDRNAGDR
jgi:hypothetical protein